MSDDEMSLTVEVLYSSLTEPEFPDIYTDKFAYLRELGATVEIIDVYENEDTPDVVGTPVIIVTQNGNEERYFDIHAVLRHVAAVDAYGQTILHQLSFADGKRIGEKLDGNRHTIQKSLRDVLSGRASQISLTDFNLEERHVAVEITLKDPDADGKCSDVAAFLSGLFTAVFGEGVNVKETSCMRQGDAQCVFSVAEAADATGKIKKFTGGDG